MASRNGKAPARPRLDRFATHRALVGEVAELTRTTGSAFAALAAFIFWDAADGRTGIVRGMSVSRLAELMGTTRDTARAAIHALVQAGLLEPRGEGRVPDYLLEHVERTQEGGRN